MSLTIGDLVGYIRADGSDFERNLARSQLSMEGFQLGVDGRLRDISGRFVDEAQVMGRALADGFTEAEREGTRITTVFDSVAHAQSRTLRGRVRAVQAAARRMGSTLERVADRVERAWSRIDWRKIGGGAVGLGKILANFTKISAALGGVLQGAAGVAAAVAEIGPAAGVAVSGLIAVRLAAVALKLGMVGVEDAVTAALDPSKTKEFNEALKKLSPSAQAFAKQVKALAPEFKRLQQDVQERLFKGLDGVLKDMGKTTLPVLRNGLVNASGALNLMAKNVGNTAVGLSKSGTLGTAISWANQGLFNLSRIPGQIVQGLVQIGAAAGPSFAKLTGAAGKAFDKFADKMQKAFESGAMQRAIEEAIRAVGQLLRVVGNFARGVRNIFSGITQDGGGLFDILEKISAAFMRLTASKEFQSILNQLSMTAGTLVDAILPLLLEAFRQLAPVIEALAPVVREFIEKIGPELIPVIQELGPVLVDIAKILEEQLPFAILLTTTLLQVLVIALRAVHWVLQNVVIPVVTWLRKIFESDFVQSLGQATKAITAFVRHALSSWENFKRTVTTIMSVLLVAVVDRVNKIRNYLVDGVLQAVNRAASYFQGLPSQILAALGDIGNLLYGAGQRIIGGFMAGIRSSLGPLRAQLSAVTSMIPDWKGPAERDARLLTPAGRSVMQGFMGGIASQVPALQRQLAGITTGLPGMAMGAGAGAYGNTAAAAQRPIVIQLTGPGLKDVIRDIVQVDGGDVQVSLGR
ncbi:phage tail protein [Streptomyces roseicoloratus]|uniref:phage tail protein n=1 Tax=Streptomyces roseicoloratus TaxID=2508722 RepID=UPI001009C619|nr:hypothetical protein [Streptomyces roseicoloratus]